MNKKRLEEIRKLVDEPEYAAEFLDAAPQAIWDLLDYVEKLKKKLKEALEAAEGAPPMDCCKPKEEEIDDWVGWEYFHNT